MSLAEQMQNMTDSFLHAHDFRANALKEIIEETNSDLGDTRKMMRDVHAERLENTESLQKSLRRAADTLGKEVGQTIKGFRTARRHMSAELHQELAKLTETLAKESRDTLRRFRATHQALSGKQGEDLAKFVKSLEAEAEDLCKAAQVMMKSFHKDQQKMSHELQESLSGFAGQNHKRSVQFLKGCNTERKQAAETQKTSLTDFVDTNAKETRQLRKHATAEQKKRMEALQEQTEVFLKGVHQTVRQMKKAAHEMTEGFHDDHTKARQAWQRMAVSMAKRREGVSEEPATASEAEKRGEREAAAVKLLTETPEGMTLAELSYAMELPSAAASKTLKHMLKRKDAAIRKKGHLYLAS
jgi:Sec-independent protein translocase protein TatA